MNDKDYDRRKLAFNIKDLRKKKNLNQVELSQKMHVSQQTVAAWETGRAIPGSDTLGALADYFGTTTDYLLGRNNSTPQLSIEPVKNNNAVTSTDLDEMLDNARSFDGKPMSDHDRDVIKNMLKGYYLGKEG